MAQLVVNPVVEKNPYEYLGGFEGLGKDGGYHNIEVHFPELWKSELVKRWLRKRPGNPEHSTLAGLKSSWRGQRRRSMLEPLKPFCLGLSPRVTVSSYRISSISMSQTRPPASTTSQRQQ